MEGFLITEETFSSGSLSHEVDKGFFQITFWVQNSMISSIPRTETKCLQKLHARDHYIHTGIDSGGREEERSWSMGAATLQLAIEISFGELHSQSKQLVWAWHQGNKANIIYLRNDFICTYILELFLSLANFYCQLQTETGIQHSEQQYHGNKNVFMKSELCCLDASHFNFWICFLAYKMAT